MLPLVSIIIPSYNHSRYIVQALDSVLADTYPNKEIVVIDDGSKDNSAAVIEEWILRNPQEKILFHKRENRGICATLNELIMLSSGKYLVLLASDDVLHNNTISERVEILEKNSNKLVLISDAEVINEKGELLFTSSMTDYYKVDKNNYKSDEGILREILFNFSISGAVVMSNRAIYDLIGMYPVKYKSEDLHFYLNSAIVNKILFFDKVVSKYRRHDSNTSGNGDIELVKSIIQINKKALFIVSGLNFKLRLFKRIVGLYYFNFRQLF